MTETKQETMETGPGWRLDPGEYAATIAKIAKINARAEKKGFTGRLAVEGKRVEVVSASESIPGFEVTKVFYETKITGEAPSYGGWKFLATAEWDSNAGLIIRTAPGVESVDRESLREGWCDHCQTMRYRKATYLVHNDSTGVQVQVGSTCIKDFLGWQGRMVFLSSDSVEDEIKEFIGHGTYSQPEWLTDTVLAASWAAIRAYGFVPASSYDGRPTKETVLKILNPQSKFDREERDALSPWLAGSYPQAKIIRDWILSDEFGGTTEYVLNLKAIASAEYCSARSVGLLASAPQSWAKAQERDLIRKAEKAEIVNEFFGAVGDKIEIQVKIKSIRYSEGEHGTTTIYTLVADTGHVFKWFASRSALGDETDGTLYTIKGTIKKFDEYRELKSTVLTRCKLISETK